MYDGNSRKVVGRGAQPWSILETNVPGRAEQHPQTWVEVSVEWLIRYVGAYTHVTTLLLTYFAPAWACGKALDAHSRLESAQQAHALCFRARKALQEGKHGQFSSNDEQQ